MRYRYHALALLTIACVCVSARAQVNADDEDIQAAKTRNKWAVLVGISVYPELKYPPGPKEKQSLDFAHEDMIGLKERLRACGFPEENIILLPNTAAKKADIKKALDTIV